MITGFDHADHSAIRAPGRGISQARDWVSWGSSMARVMGTVALCASLPGCGEKGSPTRVYNDAPTACFAVSPLSGTSETDFTFDGSCSRDPQEDPAALQLRWDWENDAVWNTEWSTSKTATHRFGAPGAVVVRMEVRDSGGLTHVIADTIVVGAPNRPPSPCFVTGPAQGTTETLFQVDASCSTDGEDAADSLRIRWDWENDGAWDTGWTRSKTADHRYPTIGRKVIRMETADTGGLTGEAVDSVEVAIDYLGMTPPGMLPQVFPPASLRATYVWTWHGSPAFSPDGREMFFCRYIHTEPEHSELVFVRRENGFWSAPQPAPFRDLSRFENNPWYSAGGDTLYYVSRGEGFIFRVTRTSGGWSLPTPLPVTLPAGATPGLQFCFSRTGTLYAELYENGDADIYRWQKRDGGYTNPEVCGGTINSPYPEFAPLVDPEERFLLFCSQRPGGFGRTDIYLSRARDGGGWEEAVNLGSQVNSPSDDGWPSISPDGRFLFFVSPRAPGSRGYEPLWVDVRFLEGFGS